MDKLIIAGRQLSSRLFLGTGKFGSPQAMEDAVIASGTELVTVALKRVDAGGPDPLLQHLRRANVQIMPNTSGARTAQEAVFVAQLAREALETNWVKLEIHPDPKYLLPDAMETLKATEMLAKQGFIVLPYIPADPVLCKQLESAGTAAVMPLGAPIGTNKGLRTIDFLEIIIEQSKVPVVIDAGLGAPSDAARALEIGADAVLVNTAIAAAGNPTAMAQAFRLAAEAGRLAWQAKLAPIQNHAASSSPLTAFLDA